VVRVCRFEDRLETMPRLPGLSPVELILFSPDGRFLLQQGGGQSPRFRVWDLTGSAARLVVEDTTDGEKVAAAFRPDGRQLAVRAGDGSVRVMDSAEGTIRQRLPPGSARHCLFALHPHRHWLALADGTAVRVVDAEAGREVARLTHPSRVESIDWHPDGRLLASGCGGGEVYLWDGVDGQRVWASTRHGTAVSLVSFHPSAAVLTSLDGGSRMRLWDLSSGTELLAGTGNVGPWSVDKASLQYQWQGADLRLFRLAPQRVLRRLVLHAEGSRQALDGAILDTQDRWLACGSPAGLVLFDLWDHSGRAIRPGPRHQPVAFDRSDGLLAASDSGLVRWPGTPGLGETYRFGPPDALFTARCERKSASCSANQAVAALGCPRSGALLWRRDHPRGLLPLGPQDSVGLTAVSPDGRWVVTGSNIDNLPHSGVKVWDSTTGGLARDLPLDCARHLKFSPDGRWLATTDLTRAQLWRVGSWQEGPLVAGLSITFAPDGLMAVGQRAVVCLVDPDTGKEYARLDATDEPNPIPWCFSSDGSLLVVVGRDTHTLLLWDLRALREELAARGMDWDRLPYPPAPARPTSRTVCVLFDQGWP
jgi:WD40 repeat protein